MATQQVAFRIPEDMLTEVDQVAAWMAASNPGVRVTRADVIRYLLARGLKALDRQKRGRVQIQEDRS